MHVMQLLGTGHKNKILVSSSPGPTQSTLLGIKGAIHLNAIFPPLDTALIFFFQDTNNFIEHSHNKILWLYKYKI